MNRRKVLVTLVSGTALFLIYRVFLKPNARLRTALEEGLRAYGIQAEGADRFLADLVAFPERVRGQLLPWYGYGSDLKDSLVRGLLLSSVVSERSGSRYVTFRALADPYARPCAMGESVTMDGSVWR